MSCALSRLRPRAVPPALVPSTPPPLFPSVRFFHVPARTLWHTWVLSVAGGEMQGIKQTLALRVLSSSLFFPLEETVAPLAATTLGGRVLSVCRVWALVRSTGPKTGSSATALCFCVCKCVCMCA